MLENCSFDLLLLIIDYLLSQGEMKERFMKKTEEYLKANLMNPANFDEQRSLDLERVKIAKDIRKHFVDRISRVLVMVEPCIIEDWFNALKDLFSKRDNVTYEKLDRIAHCPVLWEEKTEWIKLWCKSDDEKTKAGFPLKPGNSQWLDPFLCRRTFFFQV
jgi:hypothetical protein